MASAERPGTPQPTQFELGFDPVDVPAGFPPFLGQDFAPAAGHLNSEPLVELVDGELPRRYRLPYELGIDEVPAGGWTHVRKTEGISPADSKVVGVSFFNLDLKEHTKLVSYRSAPPAGIADLERNCEPMQLHPGADGEALVAVADRIHEAVRDISRFALSGSQAESPELPSITILGVDPEDPQLVSLRYRDPANPDMVVVYRPTGGFERDGGRGRTFEEVIYTGVGELADGEDPADRYKALGTIKGETLIKFTPQAEIWQRDLYWAQAVLFTEQGDQYARSDRALRAMNNFAQYLTPSTRAFAFGSESSNELPDGGRDDKYLQGRTPNQLYADIDELMESLEIPVTHEDVDKWVRKEQGAAVTPDLLDIYKGMWPVFQALVLEKGYDPRALKA